MYWPENGKTGEQERIVGECDGDIRCKESGDQGWKGIG